MRIVPSICISPFNLLTDSISRKINTKSFDSKWFTYIYTKVLVNSYDFFFWNADKWSNKIIFHERYCLVKKMIKSRISSTKSLRKLILGIFPKSRLLFLKVSVWERNLYYLYIWYCCYCYFCIFGKNNSFQILGSNKK